MSFKPLKIVHLITRLILGGAQENTLITCRLLAQRGHDVTLITGPAFGPEGELFNQAKKDKYKVMTTDRLIRPIRPINDAICYKQIKQLLRNINPDVVHTHSAKAGIIGRYAGWTIKNKDNQNRPAVIHTIHGLAFHAYQNPLLNKFYISIEKAAAPKTDCFICVADAMTKQAIEAGIGTPEKFVTAYSAIDEQAFVTSAPEEKIQQFRKQHGIPQDAIVMVTVARLFELKGHDDIIRSVVELSKKFPKAYWLFVGDGILSEQYKQQAAQLGLEDRIRFAGLIPPSEVPLAIHASDILLHCSLREGLARAIPQGLLCGKPVIAYDLDGTPEVVNERTGRLVEPRNITKLVESCAELLADENLRNQLGRNGCEEVKTKFTPETMVDTIEQVYKETLEYISK